ncbi:MAG TPA: phosphate-starvation-inducible PsiE family protein [Rubrobacteraceae bacterium]|nr:phosphate-starvation-inducible PsiE family protein [Rubrobacteraceae bacterium]
MTGRPRREYRLASVVELAERVAYYGAALFLMVTMGMVFVSAINSVMEVAQTGLLSAALAILDKVLLIFIFIELLGTINTIVQEHEVVAEPFLLIGIIAVVRRILAVTVSIEQSLGTPKFDQLLFELGVLTVLVISLAISLHFTRRLERSQPNPTEQ